MASDRGPSAGRMVAKSGARLLELATELLRIETVLGHFARSEEDDGDIVGVARGKLGVEINVDLMEARAKLAKERRQGLLGFVTEVAAGTRVEGDIARARQRQTASLAAPEFAATLAATEQAVADQHDQGAMQRVALGIEAYARGERGQIERIAAKPFKEFQQVSRERIHGGRERKAYGFTV
jgi:hypothetical protein